MCLHEPMGGKAQTDESQSYSGRRSSCAIRRHPPARTLETVAAGVEVLRRLLKSVTKELSVGRAATDAGSRELELLRTNKLLKLHGAQGQRYQTLLDKFRAEPGSPLAALRRAHQGAPDPRYPRGARSQPRPRGGCRREPVRARPSLGGPRGEATQGVPTGLTPVLSRSPRFHG